MLTDTQVRVLATLNDYCDIHDRLNLQPERGLPECLADLALVDKEVYTAIGDLHELGLIEGMTVGEHDFPVVILGLTAQGRQELP